ncbi:MAG: peptidoglycan binding protein CsiV [gamma proteobacterium symbiont of Taylorina sp.]|nr:peptidoglycan binding protein CsiV [gamma proteobacterium symbiont of Taylorina sp.]
MKHQANTRPFSFLLKKIFILLLSGVSFIVSVQTIAAAAPAQSKQKPKQYYIVELILFRHINRQGEDNEYWDSSVPEIENGFESDSINNIPSSALAQYNLNNKKFTPLYGGVSALSPEHYQLRDSAAHIKYSKDFQLLAHFGWTQRSLSKNRALPIRITSDQYSENLLPTGTLTLFVSRFLHMKVDLSAGDCVYSKNPINKPVSDSISDNQPGEEPSNIDQVKTNTNTDNFGCVNQTYLFSQSRKMRSKELHYIDNPVFGLLIYVTPYTSNGG